MGPEWGIIGIVPERPGTKDLHVYVPAELFERVQLEARAQRRSVNNLILVLIEQGLEQLQRRASA